MPWDLNPINPENMRRLQEHDARRERTVTVSDTRDASDSALRDAKAKIEKELKRRGIK